MSVIKISSPATREFWELPVLFEDADLLALDKPVGLLLSPDRENPDRPNLMTLLHEGIAAGKPWATERKLSYLSQAHRLDPEASGVLLLAKSKEALVAVADHFGAETPGLKYVTLVNGGPREDRLEVNAKLAPHPMRPEMMRVDPQNGKKSRSIFEVVERFADYTLMRCRVATLRPHQLRVHLQNSGLRVVGDELYGGKPLLLSELKRDYRLKPNRVERPLIGQPIIHGEEIELPQPTSKEMIKITSPWPKPLRVALKYLREFGV